MELSLSTPANAPSRSSCSHMDLSRSRSTELSSPRRSWSRSRNMELCHRVDEAAEQEGGTHG